MRLFDGVCTLTLLGGLLSVEPPAAQNSPPAIYPAMPCETPAKLEAAPASFA